VLADGSPGSVRYVQIVRQWTEDLIVFVPAGRLTSGQREDLPSPPTKHQLALMIWIAVFPTLTVLNLALGGWLKTLSPVPRTFILATVAVPIVIYGLMPQLHRLRSRLLAHAGRHHSRQTPRSPRNPSARQDVTAPVEN